MTGDGAMGTCDRCRLPVFRQPWGRWAHAALAAGIACTVRHGPVRPVSVQEPLFAPVAGD